MLKMKLATHLTIFASPSSLYRTAEKTGLESLNHLYLDKCRSLHVHFSFSNLFCRLEGRWRPCPSPKRPKGGARPATWTDKRGSPPLCLPWYHQLFWPIQRACSPYRLHSNMRVLMVCVVDPWWNSNPQTWYWKWPDVLTKLHISTR